MSDFQIGNDRLEQYTAACEVFDVGKSVEKEVLKSVHANLLGMWVKVITATDVEKRLEIQRL